MNKCILRVVDTSVYAEGIAVTCPLLQITAPGFIHPVNFSTPQIEPGFTHNFTACDLELQSYNCGTEFMDIPDGIYIIKYSVEPKEYVYVEYNHLRVTALRKKLKDEWCKLKLSACEPIPETQNKFLSLMQITGYIDAAQAKAEYCLDSEQAMVLYNYAKKLLDNYSCKLC